MNIVDKLSFDNLANTFDPIYIRSENLMLKVYRTSWNVTDLTNAGRRGLKCVYISGNYDFESCQLLKFLSAHNWQAGSLFSADAENQFKYVRSEKIGGVYVRKANFRNFRTNPEGKARGQGA